MWMLKNLTHKESTGLEGVCVDFGNCRVNVQNAIDGGRFSTVYLARDGAHATKQYALKHMMCTNEESLALAMKEIHAMEKLKGHPNIVTLYASKIFDTGRNKEAHLLMELGVESLCSALNRRGTGYFNEQQILSIFMDVCSAVFAMHSCSPPIAHRDLKAENLLKSHNGSWMLCDFGSTSTIHKRFEKPEEMGIEEDNIRMHTTPAYRAPEMVDLFRRDLISEKVDIWALGCLLFRICYLKNAFDGESKLQILNGNYSIPECPRYSPALMQLIGDMLRNSPADRPEIAEVISRVNQLQTRAPGESSDTLLHTETSIGAAAKHMNVEECGGQLGAFWSTQNAKDSLLFDNQTRSTPKKGPGSSTSGHDKSLMRHMAPINSSHPINTAGEIDRLKFSSQVSSSGSGSSSSSKARKEAMKEETSRLKQELQQAVMEKGEMEAKFEKLSAVCRSQKQEIHDLKQALAACTQSKCTSSLENQQSPASLLSKSKGSQPWLAFATADDAVREHNHLPISTDSRLRSAWERDPHEKVLSGQLASDFGTERFTAADITPEPELPKASREGPHAPKPSLGAPKGVISPRAEQPAGWADF